MTSLFCTNIQDFCIVDTETTGLDSTSCELLEIAVIKIIGGHYFDKFHSYIKPSKSIPLDITAINGIVDDQVSNAPLPKDILPAVRRFIGTMLIVGQNVKFDLSFMNYHGNNIFSNVSFIDNREVAISLLHNLSSYSQSALEDHFSVLNMKKHSAMGDAEALLEIFMKLMEDNKNVDFSKYIRR